MEARPIFSFEPLKTHAIKFPGHPHSLLISQTDLLSRGVSVTWALNSRVSPWPQARRGSVSDLPTHQGAESERSPILEIPEQITDRYDPDDTAVLSDREMPDALLCHEVARLMGRAIDFHRDHRRTHHGSRWLA